MHLPSDTLIFLFTDIEGSTRKWEEFPNVMRPALEWHDALLQQAIENNGGQVFKAVGDAFYATFPNASGAVAAVLQAQQALASQTWEPIGALRIRVGIHSGPAQQRGSDYFGPTLGRVARLQGIGHGGQTLLSQAAADLARDTLPAGAWLKDLGSHRLKDLGQPEHVFQLCLPGLPEEFPSVRSLQAFANNLPLQLTSFVGREQEMLKVKDLLARHRLVTLTGVGGTGKTCLCLQVAADLIEQYGDGVWLVELAALSDPSLVPSSLAVALGVLEEPGRGLTETLTDYLRPKKMLLLLDNCEHLVHACACLVQAILETCAGVTILVTSREALNVAGERPWRVPALSQPDPSHLPLAEKELGSILLGYDAVRLFVERARVQQGEFVLSRGNASSVAQVCVKLDGIPLAIELAAARTRSLTVEDINSRLDDRFRLLTGGARTALPRQQTLRALIDWSYDLLNEPEQTLLCRLSVFAGGWSLEAAETVCAGEDIEPYDVLDLLASLVDKSLVMYDAEAETGRYRLLETVRQYGAERLAASGTGPGVRARHWDYFLALAEQAEPQLTGPEQGVWLSRLERDYDNLRAVLAWSETEIETAEEGVAAWLRLCVALWRFWQVRGHFFEGRHWLGRVLSRTEGLPASTLRAQALIGAGALSFEQGNFEAARALLGESLDLYRQLGNPQGIAISLTNLGGVAHTQGDYRTARSLLEESIDLFRQFGDQRGIAKSLGNLALVASDQGDYTAARTLLAESLNIKRQLGDQRGIANLLNNLGAFLVHTQSDCLAARSLLEESLDLYRQLGDQGGVARALNNLSAIAHIQGHCPAARALLEESLDLYRLLGDQWGIASSLNSLGDVARTQGDYELARSLHEESLDIRCQIGEQRGIAYSLEGLAGVAASEGHAARAARLWGAADTLREQIGAALFPPERERLEQRLAQARQALGEEAFFAAFAAGQALIWEQAVEEAQDH